MTQCPFLVVNAGEYFLFQISFSYIFPVYDVMNYKEL